MPLITGGGGGGWTCQNYALNNGGGGGWTCQNYALNSGYELNNDMHLTAGFYGIWECGSMAGGGGGGCPV